MNKRPIFVKKAGCTFCKSKEHSYHQCSHPDNHRNRKQINHVGSDTKAKEEDDPELTVGGSKTKN
jgi:hypothetical protein